MTTYLIIGANTLGQSVARRLATQTTDPIRLLHAPNEKVAAELMERVTDQVGDLTKEATYQAALQDQPVIFSALQGLDVDLAFEALFDAQYHQQLMLTRFVMLSTAGVDHEINGELTYPDITNVKEYLNQQRYAAKLVDESEFPYTILRPVTLTADAETEPQIIPEGATVPAGHVSRETVAAVATQILLNGEHDYQSLAIC